MSIKGASGSIEAKPRTIVVKGAVDHSIFTTSRENYVYFHLREALKPFTGSLETVSIVEDLSIRIEWVKTSIGEYYIVIQPQHFDSKYLIIAEEEVCVAIPSKRRFNVEVVEDTAILYIY